MSQREQLHRRSSRRQPAAAGPSVRFPYAPGRLLRYVVFAGVLVIAGIWLLLRTEEWTTRFWAIALIGFAAAVVVVYGRTLFDKRPAIIVSARGLTAQRLGRHTIPWRDIEHVRLRRENRTVLWVIPLNVASLAVSVNLDAAFWNTGGILRRASRWLSKESGDHEVRVPLVGLAGDVDPERVLAAISELQPHLIRETIITEIS